LSVVTDNNNGTYGATLTSSASPGLATITGTLNGLPITDNATVDFQFGPPVNLVATANGTGQVVLTWDAVSGATGYDVYRATVIPSYTSLVSTGAAPGYTDNSVGAGTSYIYLVRATSATLTSAFSAPDAATTIVFTDPTLNSTVTIKKLHLDQLRLAIGAMRVAANLPVYSFTDPTITAGSTAIKATHISQARIALDAARVAIGLPALVYTDPTLTQFVTAAKAVHITQLRAGTQ
jgi:hypothetical protein